MGNVIGSLSLGATRTFRIRHNKSKETKTFPEGNGTLIIMAGTMQQFWRDEGPKTTENVGEGINLTFRKIEMEQLVSHLPSPASRSAPGPGCLWHPIPSRLR